MAEVRSQSGRGQRSGADSKSRLRLRVQILTDLTTDLCRSDLCRSDSLRCCDDDVFRPQQSAVVDLVVADAVELVIVVGKPIDQRAAGKRIEGDLGQALGHWPVESFR